MQHRNKIRKRKMDVIKSGNTSNKIDKKYVG
jgi:hypothetical protein